MMPSNTLSTLVTLTVSEQHQETEIAVAIRVRGTVQGVGFRPTVYRLAQECQLRGTVGNDGAGVLIQVVGQSGAIDRFIQCLQTEAPLLARIETITQQLLTGESEVTSFPDFRIVPSLDTPVRTEIAPDAATCPQCYADIFDPFSRFYRYPFTNCTHCGPRLSIVRAIPYDRAHTSMASFPMCPICQRDYEDVSDRRFHAQPVACHVCGPKAWLERADGKPIIADMFSMLDDVDAACTLLQRGEIVAIKGIGGVHLACDATNEAAVQTLRQRKHRYHKPFALMARDVAIIEQYCDLNESERQLLHSPAAPIVLLKPKPPSSSSLPLSSSIAPDLNVLGCMLPYTPLHHLILRQMNRPIVLTSGNLSDEPQCIDNDEARQKLGGIADYLLLHDREIVNRVDDSVVRMVEGQPQILRRARGYAPAPIRLPVGFEQAPVVLAMGSELKTTVCLLDNGRAIVSQHLGDLEQAPVFAAYQDTLKLYLDVFQHQPQVIAIDLHPEYLSTKFGQALAVQQSLPLCSIQHHHAHIAACMVENGLPLDHQPILGIALDGLGFGEDGTLWGGEFLFADYRQFQRLARFKPIAMLGGTQAIYHPWRNTYAHFMAAFDWDDLNTKYGNLECMQFLEKQPRSLLNQLLQKGIHSPLASSAGRLFDAVAAAIGVCSEQVSYEGQAAIQLEALIQPNDLEVAQASPYPFDLCNIQNTATFIGVKGGVGALPPPQGLRPCNPVPDSDENRCSNAPIFEIDSKPLWSALLDDLQQSVPISQISAKFHLGLATAIAQMCQCLNRDHAFAQIALTGGVFQNEILARAVSQQLTDRNFTVLTHHQVPPNDGGISLGQAAIAAARSLVGHKLGVRKNRGAGA
jgi:hydrogenase maturation protein HypF